MLNRYYTETTNYIEKLLKDKKLSKHVTNIMDAIKKKDSDAAIAEINSVKERIAK